MHEKRPLRVYSDIYLIHPFFWLNWLKSDSMCRNMNTRTLKISGLPSSDKLTTTRLDFIIKDGFKSTAQLCMIGHKMAALER